jgi:hypothetical protein
LFRRAGAEPSRACRCWYYCDRAKLAGRSAGHDPDGEADVQKARTVQIEAPGTYGALRLRRKRLPLERSHARARRMACEVFYPSTVRCVSRTTSPGRQSLAVTNFVALLGGGGKNLSHLL